MRNRASEIYFVWEKPLLKTQGPAPGPRSLLPYRAVIDIRGVA
jgi:hypothetical protein